MTLNRPFASLPGIILFWLMMSQLVQVKAQDGFYEKVFTSEDGLSHNNILDMAQDSTGFLWLGTWDGLSRFDGYEFHNYFHNPDDSASLPSFSVSTVKVDRHNNVWLLPTAPRLTLYNPETDNFKTIDDPVLREKEIFQIHISDLGDLWISGLKGMAVYDHQLKKFKPVRIYDESQKEVVDQQVYQVSFDGAGHMWFITPSNETYKGNVTYTAEGISVYIIERHYLPDFPGRLFQSQQLNNHVLKADLEGRTWLVSNWGCQPLEPYRGKDFVLDGFGEPELQLHGQLPFIWYRYHNNIIVLTPGGKKTVIPLDEGEFPIALTLDKHNTIWYSTFDKFGSSTGLHRFNKTPAYFRHHFEQFEGVQTAVYAITQDARNNLLIASRSNSFVACFKPDGSMIKLNVLPHREFVRTYQVRSMIADSNGVWIGYMQHRLDYINYKTNETVNHALTNDEPFGFRIMYRDAKGDLLIGTNALYIYQPQKRLFKKIWTPGLSGRNILCIKPDPEGVLWVGSSKELVKLRKDYTVDTVYQVCEMEYSIEDLCFDDNGGLWLALMGGGLEKFDPATGKGQFFTTAKGLSNNTTYNILKDRQGKLWITTDRGISRFDPVTEKFRIFGNTDGLRITEFNSDASYQASDGQIFFGGMGGVVSFYPDSINSSESMAFSCRLLITEFTVSGVRMFFQKPVYDLNYIKLRKGDDNFGVTFACLNFRNPDKVQYRYRIKEIRADWIETDYQHRHMNIAGLDPGKYLLEIESTDILGNWNNHTELLIEIPPFFYQTIWFILILMVLGGAAIVAIFIYNNRQIRIKELQKQNYLKLESIKGQMNPHFIFNSLNSINYFIAKNDRLSANRYIASFSKLIRSFLNNMSQEYVPLSDEIESLREYLRLEFLRFGDKFNYTINTDKLTDIASWEVFPGIVQPFIENAIWHGVRGLVHRKGTIAVTFSENSNHICCEITDDGIGRLHSLANRSDHSGRKSRGINLVHERMYIINHLENKNYQVVISDLYPDKKECGTVVRVDIPSRCRVPEFNPKPRISHDY